MVRLLNLKPKGNNNFTWDCQALLGAEVDFVGLLESTLALPSAVCLSLKDLRLAPRAKGCFECKVDVAEPFETVDIASTSFPSLFLGTQFATTHFGLKGFPFLPFP